MKLNLKKLTLLEIIIIIMKITNVNKEKLDYKNKLILYALIRFILCNR